MISKQCRMLCGAAAILTASCVGAVAQIDAPQAAPPPANSQGQVCQRLEQQLAAVDRGGSNDPARADQIRRYEEAAAKQQAELDGMVARARRLGCENTGFFDLFRGGPNAQCAPLNSQISQMRGNLDRIMNDLAAPPARRRGLRARRPAPRAAHGVEPQRLRPAISAGSSAVAARHATCSTRCSAPIPVSSPTRRATALSHRLRAHLRRIISSRSRSPRRRAVSPMTQRTCQRMCPAAEAVLYTHRNPGEDMNQAVSAGGRLYSELPNAFKFRQEFNAACSLQETGRDLGRCAQGSRGPLNDRTRRHRGDRRTGEGDERAARSAGPPDSPRAGARQARCEGGRSSCISRTLHAGRANRAGKRRAQARDPHLRSAARPRALRRDIKNRRLRFWRVVR